MRELDFIHRYEPASVVGGPPILLLHGTGGDENDLIDLGQAVAPGSALLSPRGKVLENGMPRFFRRLAEGVLDEADVRRRTDELADFVEAARQRYGLAAPIALGFSNGANIAAAILTQRPQTLAGAVLLRAMVPLAQPANADLAGKQVLILSGAQDPIVPAANAARLTAQLRERHALVEQRILEAGHGLTNKDVELTTNWFKTRTATTSRLATT